MSQHESESHGHKPYRFEKIPPFFIPRTLALQALKESGLEWNFVAVGQWLEFLVSGFFGIFNAQDNTVIVPGEGKFNISLTTIKDSGLLAAEAILHPQSANKIIRIATENTSWEGLIKLFEEATGKPATRIHKSLDQLNDEIQKASNLMESFRPTVLSLFETANAAYYYEKPFNHEFAADFAHIKTDNTKEFIVKVVNSPPFNPFAN
jgi:hypothetical protein